MAESGVKDVLDRLLAVGERGDNRRVLAAGLGKEAQAWIVAEHREGGLRAAGQNDGIDLGMIDKAAALFAAGARQELERVLRDAGPPKTLAEFPRDQDGVGRRLQNYRVPCSQGSGHAAAGD